MFEAIILGAVQGLTEFLPISSTAHLILLPWFFNWRGDVNTLTFDIALHAGTLCALLIFFWRDWFEILMKKRRLLGFILLASVPAGTAGLLLDDIVSDSPRSPYTISISLVVIGFVMLLSENIYRHKTIDDISLSDALIIGVLQAVALIPGVSRSGITISAGLFRGLQRDESARFSFLLSTPVIAGATLLHAEKMIAGDGHYNLPLFAAGFATATAVGFIAIKFLLYYFKKHPINIFVYYRFLLAGVIILMIWAKR